MDTDRVNRWLTLGANLGVLVGIFLLVFELRQNQQMMRSEIRNDLSVGLNDVLLVNAVDKDLSAAFIAFERGDTVTDVQLEQIWSWENAIFRYWENVHYQYRNGLYDEVEFTAQRSAWGKAMVRSRSHRYHWCDWRETYSPEFRQDIDGLVPPGGCDEFDELVFVE